MERVTHSRAGWSGSVDLFLQTDHDALSRALNEFERNLLGTDADVPQTVAWADSLRVLTEAFKAVITTRAEVGQWSVIFEFLLPRERGRRPDVVILAGDAVLVLEFKGYSVPLRAHVDQVAAYARDLRHYHAGSHGKSVVPALVLTKTRNVAVMNDNVRIVSADMLGRLLEYDAGRFPNASVDPQAWMDAQYAPLPSLVDAARRVFEHEPLPQIRRAQSAGIPDTVARLLEIAHEAKSKGERHLALVTGVPGAGKTLVGLQFVYARQHEGEGHGPDAVFLSGNGPLVSVLQHALKSKVFVRDVHAFLLDYGGATSRKPNEHIWVYDEAQRAWDESKVREKRQDGRSEPEDFLRLGERVGDWSMLVGLIGQGQEIHIGEESGLDQWNDAVRAVGGNWVVHAPQHVARVFQDARSVYPEPVLNLDQSLRSHLAQDVQAWVSAVLEGSIDEARSMTDRMRQQGFVAYLTRNIDEAKGYVEERYRADIDKRYGFLASNKATNLAEYGVFVEFAYARHLKNRIGPWFNDPPGTKNSCCQFNETAREFECQGLELDMPIVCWGDDLKWLNGAWRSRLQPRSKAKDPHQLRVNSYRVLLSRGRDGIVVFVPPTSDMDSTAEILFQAGLEKLTGTVTAQ